MKFIDLGHDIFVIEGFFSEEECEAWIQKSEAIGYDEATVNLGRRQVMKKHIRNNERLVYDDKDLALSLWERVEPFAPQETNIGTAVGLNERFRFYKYHIGQVFKPHKDGSFIRNIHEWSAYTFLIYLNEDMVGGATKFQDQLIQPKTGMAVIFKHSLVHEGCEVVEGMKYVLRSDIMYRRKV